MILLCWVFFIFFLKASIWSNVIKCKERCNLPGSAKQCDILSRSTITAVIVNLLLFIMFFSLTAKSCVKPASVQVSQCHFGTGDCFSSRAHILWHMYFVITHDWFHQKIVRLQGRWKNVRIAVILLESWYCVQILSFQQFQP